MLVGKTCRMLGVVLSAYLACFDLLTSVDVSGTL